MSVWISNNLLNVNWTSHLSFIPNIPAHYSVFSRNCAIKSTFSGLNYFCQSVLLHKYLYFMVKHGDKDQLCDFILKILVYGWKREVIFGTRVLYYLSQSLGGSLLESPWTALTWISSPNRSCSIWRDTPVRTCRGKQIFTWTPTTTSKQTKLTDTSVFTWTGTLYVASNHFKLCLTWLLMICEAVKRSGRTSRLVFQSNWVDVSCCIKKADGVVCQHTLKLHWDPLRHAGSSRLLI